MDADAGDADPGGQAFGPVIPTMQSSIAGAPPSAPAIVLGPGYSGHVVLHRATPQTQTQPAASPEDAAAGRADRQQDEGM